MRTTKRVFPPTVMTLMLAPLLVLALAGCGDATDEAASSAGAPGGPSSEESTTPALDDDDTDDAEETIELDHAGALAAGLSGGSAIACVYHYDDEELASIRQFSPTGWTTPTSDVYLHGNAVYWEIPQEDGRTSHVLGLDDMTYAWKTPSREDRGASSETPGGQDGLAEKLERNATDCMLYTGPMTIFEVPTDVPF